MKNYVKDGQKLPIWGIGPYIIGAMGGTAIIGIVVSCYVLKSGFLSAPWNTACRIIGAAFMLLGIAVWYIGAVRSGMDDNIADNKLKTDGIYAWVRNPMYSGWWFLIAGICLMWANAWLLIVIPVDWLIMTIVLINTEEKWLLDLYGDAYAVYRESVNRCVPWFPRK